MRELIREIEEGLGPMRLDRLRSDEEAHQDFWEGVLRAYHRVDWSRDHVGFLISSGYFHVSNLRKARCSKELINHCPRCGHLMGFRTMTCALCGGEVEYVRRYVPYVDHGAYEDDYVVETMMDLRRYVDSLTGKVRRVAVRWLIDRADLMHDNHCRVIGGELGISPARVAQIKGRIRRGWREWINRDAPTAHHVDGGADEEM